MKAALCWIKRIIAAALVTGLPFVILGGPAVIRGEEADAVSSATLISEGDFNSDGGITILINDSARLREENALLWKEFFEGGAAPDIFEDISVLVIEGDEEALKFCDYCMGRLPVNQMKVRDEQALLVFSKAKYGRFDIIVMSSSLFDSYGSVIDAGDGNITITEVS